MEELRDNPGPRVIKCSMMWVPDGKQLGDAGVMGGGDSAEEEPEGL